MSNAPLLSIRTRYFVKHATPQARKVVLDIFRRNKDQMINTTQLFDECVKVNVRLPDRFIPWHATGTPGVVPRQGPPPPSHPHHPVRSIRYLKKVVLEDLAERGIIEKFHFQRAPLLHEVNDLVKRAVRVERRNARRVASGGLPTGNIASSIDVWTWQLTEKGHALLTRESKDELDIRSVTGELESDHDHLDDDQLRLLARDGLMPDDRAGLARQRVGFHKWAASTDDRSDSGSTWNPRSSTPPRFVRPLAVNSSGAWFARPPESSNGHPESDPQSESPQPESSGRHSDSEPKQPSGEARFSFPNPTGWFR